MRLISVISTCLVMGLLFVCAAEPGLDSLQLTYETEMRKIRSGYDASQKKLLAAYGKAIGSILTTAQRRGELQAVLAARKEQDRLQAEKAIPSESPADLPAPIRDAQRSYRDAHRRIRAVQARKTKDLTAEYVPALDRLIRNLTRAGELDEAVSVTSEKRRAEFILADTESSMPKVEQSTVLPKPRWALPQQSGLPSSLREGLVLYYDFDTDEGDKVTDKSGEGNGGRLHGVSLTSDRLRNARSACEFDGVNDYIECDRNFLAQDTLTISAWIKFSGSTGRKAIIASDSFTDPAAFLEVNGNELRIYRRGYSTGHALRPNTWYHVAGIISDSRGSSFQLYVNGVQVVDCRNPSNRGSLRGRKVRVGLIGTSFPFKGTIDELLVHDRILSRSEIAALYAR